MGAKVEAKVSAKVGAKVNVRSKTTEGTEATGKYLIPKKKPGINRLTSSKGNEIAVVSSIYSSSDSNILKSFTKDLSAALEESVGEDIPFVKKDVDIGEVFGDNFLSCCSEEQAGSGMIIDRVHRVYEAT